MDDFAEAAADFLQQEKYLKHSFRWRRKGRNYARAHTPVVGIDDRICGRVVLNAHASKMPPKYSFCLLFQNISVLRLDVNPKRSHTDFIKLQRSTVVDTHWQYWPHNHAIVDKRTFSHHIWLDEFLRRCRIISHDRYVKPPFRCENHRFNFDV